MNEMEKLVNSVRICGADDGCVGCCYDLDHGKLVVTCAKLLEDMHGKLDELSGQKTVDIEQVISDIENELAVSTSTTYRCKDGEFIGTDVGYVWRWFECYKEVLRKRYGN